MQGYNDIGGDSGVTGYESGRDYIKVQFEDGSVYLYNHMKPGAIHVENMKRLAAKGDGLNAYINENVKKAYAVQLK